MDIPNVWAVEQTKGSDVYSNGLQIENRLAVANEPRTLVHRESDDMIQSLVGGLRNAFQGTRNLPKLSRPIPLVLSGGTAMPKGFRDRFEKILRVSDFPIELSEIRIAAEPLTATAKGALVAALCDM